MISTVNFEEDNIVGFKLQDHLAEAGLRKLVQQMEEKAESHDKLFLYFEFLNFGGWDSVQSFFDTLKLKFNSWNKIVKYAIVTDKDWVQKQWRLANFLTPHFEVMAYSLEDRDEAIKWLKEHAADAPHPGIAVLEAMPMHVLGLATVGKFTSSDFHAINCILEQQVLDNKDLRLYLEVLHEDGAAPDDLWKELKQGIRFYSRLSKVALAGHEKWLDKANSLSSSLSPDIKMKCFNLDERDTAIDWLR
ncbi:SpoIIAA family protein [Pontibacter rugosus]|uniref:STAS/SEC14 domain-containing protein n=1 Tax=Pontibacter rugosus TaxID=1745966 RepID=A0ABW3SRH6_9BACT